MKIKKIYRGFEIVENKFWDGGAIPKYLIMRQGKPGIKGRVSTIRGAEKVVDSIIWKQQK